MLPSSPPTYSSWASMLAPIKVGETGWRAYALQAGLLSAGRNLALDGDFGPDTEKKLRGFQSNNGLTADGIAGPATQSAIIAKASEKAHSHYTRLPQGLLRGYAEAEGANILAATNSTVPGGIDCGVAQLRVYGPPYSQTALLEAFNIDKSFQNSARALISRIDDYRRRASWLSSERALKLAVLAHNAPFMAEQIVRNGKLSTPDALAKWTTKPGGGHYTHAEWAEVYPAKMMKYVV